MITLAKIWPDQSNLIFTSGLDCVMEPYLKQAVLRQFAEKILLMDASKTDRKSTFHICSLEEGSILVSDQNISGEFQIECKEAEVQLL